MNSYRVSESQNIPVKAIIITNTNTNTKFNYIPFNWKA